MTNDIELLRRYSAEDSEEAFAELVRRNIDLVYSTALRLVYDDSALASDVTQIVFSDLAQKSAKLGHHTSLTAWLYTTTRFVASKIKGVKL